MRAVRGQDGATTAPDLRLAPAALASWGASGWGVAVAAGTALAAGGAALLMAAAVLIAAGRSRRPDRRPVLTAVVVALACGGAVLVCTGGHLAVREAGLLPRLVQDAATVQVEGIVTGDPRMVRGDAVTARRDPLLAVRLRVTHVTGRGRSGPSRAPVLVLGPLHWSGLSPGARISATGRLAPVEAGDDVTALLIARGAPRLLAEPPPWQRGAEHLRAGLRRAVQPLPPGAGGLLPGLVVGDTSALPATLEEDMRSVGLTHLTAVSGANVAIVCGSVLVLAAAVGAGRRLRLALAGASLVGFVVLARPEPSVLRAAVMGGVGLVGLAASRRGRGVPLLCLSVVVLTGVDPWLSRSFGFALSVLATAALLLLARPMAGVLSHVMPRLLSHAVAVPLAAQVVCGPVVVLLTPQVPLLAVPANLLVAPAVAPATVLGVAAAVVAPVSLPAAQAVAWLGGRATGWIAWVATTSASIPGAVVHWPGGWPGALLLAAATAVALLVGAHLVRAGEHVRRALAAASVLALTGLLVLGGAAATRWWRSTAWPPDRWRAVACDVGQGDALVVSAGPHAAVVVDAGPDPAAVDRCLRDLRVHDVELLVLTHFHADHVGGVDGVLANRSVTRALVSPLAAPAAQARRVTQALHAAGVPVAAVSRGASGSAGELRWQVLWPDGPVRVPRSEEPEGSVANDASVVLLLEAPGLRILAAGDVEPPAQAALRRLLEAGPGREVVPVDVLKVAHHGSAAQDPALHRLLAPRVALISSGAGNDYGHPAEATLEMLASSGATVLRTDLGGHLAVGGSGDVLWAATQRPSQEDGRLGAWQQHAAAGDGRQQDGPQQDGPQQDGSERPLRRGGTWRRRRSCSSPGPSPCSSTARSTACGGSPPSRAPTSRWFRSRRASTRRGSSRRGRAPPCSASRG